MNIVDAFRDQSVTCVRMDSPFMGRLLNVLADNWRENTALGMAVAVYSGDIGPAGHSLPLRIAGGLHALVLSGKSPELTRVYPPYSAGENAFAAQVAQALAQHQDFLVQWIKLPPQTNEVRRSAALMAMARVAVSHFDRPIYLSELGASGGLNLVWDHFVLHVQGRRFGPDDAVLSLSPDWDGPAPPETHPRVADRGGVDLNPLDPTSSDDLLRMCSYLWPDQPERIERTRAAASVQRHPLDKGDAIQWLETRLGNAPPGHLHLIQHTVAWQYFPADAQMRGQELIERAGAAATADTPLAWMRMETEGDRTGAKGAALTLRLWPGDITLNLGRADFHGRWIKWQPI